MGILTAAQKKRLKRSFPWTKVHDLLDTIDANTPTTAYPTLTANGFIKGDAAGTALEAVAYGTASNTVCQGNDARIPTTDQKAALAGTSGTAPSASNKLVDAADTRLGVKKYTKTIAYTDIATAGLTNTVALSDFPANASPLSIVPNVTQEFTGGGVATCTMDLGDTAADTELLTAADIQTTGRKAGAPKALGQFEADYAGAGLKATFTSTVANLDQLTQGSLQVVIRYLDEAA